MKLTKAQRRALATEMYGFCQGSNMWPLVSLRDENDKEICFGEEIDALLRAGLLLATALGEPIFVQEGGGDIPDNEVTHRLDITPAGRRALAEQEGRDDE